MTMDGVVDVPFSAQDPSNDITKKPMISPELALLTLPPSLLSESRPCKRLADIFSDIKYRHLPS